MRKTVLYLCILIMAVSLLFIEKSMAEEDGLIPGVWKGSWKLEVKDLQHRTITAATIQFTNENAKPCLGGNWKRVVVESYQSEDDEFFPVTSLLSYETRESKIVIGHNQACDAYRHLRGRLNDRVIRGDYVSFGWGEEKLGYFSLRPSSE